MAHLVRCGFCGRQFRCEEVHARSCWGDEHVKCPDYDLPGHTPVFKFPDVLVFPVIRNTLPGKIADAFAIQSMTDPLGHYLNWTFEKSKAKT